MTDVPMCFSPSNEVHANAISRAHPEPWRYGQAGPRGINLTTDAALVTCQFCQGVMAKWSENQLKWFFGVDLSIEVDIKIGSVLNAGVLITELEKAMTVKLDGNTIWKRR